MSNAETGDDVMRGAKILAVLLLLGIVVLMIFASENEIRQQEKALSATSAAEMTEAVWETTEVEQKPITHKEYRCVSTELPAGQMRVLKQGKDGITERTVKITYKGTTEQKRQVLSECTLCLPTDSIMLVGANNDDFIKTHPADPVAENGILTTPEGEIYNYSDVLSCTATAYSCEGYSGTTAIGTTARVGAIAVDPNYIPYGTRLYIVSDDGAYIYGIATAEDCGNFRGYHIDLYFDTVDECWTFGRRTCTVYVLE